MVTVRLAPMTQDEYDAMMTRLIPAYAQDHVAAGNWTADEALNRAKAQSAELLPNGVDTANVLLRTARNDSGEIVGRVWIGFRDEGRTAAWIYEIEIDDAHRGGGYGRALLAVAEAEATHHGATSIGLNVFGPNQVARDLYTSAGYGITSIQMSKPLPEARP
jgi:ribosomal protein S18 acetylase RimI-like enzyme